MYVSPGSCPSNRSKSIRQIWLLSESSVRNQDGCVTENGGLGNAVNTKRPSLVINPFYVAHFIIHVFDIPTLCITGCISAAS